MAMATGQERYARHALIPGWDQRRLGESVVVVIGVGALGTECARLLAQAGVGTLILCDPDTVGESNLSRGALFSAEDLGRPKALVAAEALSGSAPGIRCLPRYAGLLCGVGLAELRDATVVVSALDSIAARVRLAARCNLVGAGMLDAGTHPWGGEVRYYPPGGACYGCGLSAEERAAQDDPWSCGQLVTAEHFGASAPVSALIGAWLATAVLRLCFGLVVPPGTVRVDPASGRAANVVRSADPECPLHDRVANVVKVGVGADRPVRDLLALLEPGESALTWTSVKDDLDPMHASYLLSDAPPDRPLADAGVAPRELIPVISAARHRVTRYLELSATTNGGER